MEKGKGIRLAELLVDRGVDILYVKDDFEGKGPSYVFSSADIDIRKTGVIALQELMGLKKESF
jgi:predicted Fe-Mo cluster-binding NifX family protein